jgi:hypothetical protein
MPVGKGKGKAKTKPKQQQKITASALPVLKKPLDQIGKQIGVLGAFWEGRMTAEEKAMVYKCTVREFEMLHKWDDGRPPSAAFQLQEMGVTGTGSLEHGDSSGEIFWMPYPMPYLTYHYKTFPGDLPTPQNEEGGGAAETGAGNGVVPQQEPASSTPSHALMHPDFPNLKLSHAAVMDSFKIKSDTLVEAGPKSGWFSATFECGAVRSANSIEKQPMRLSSPRKKQRTEGRLFRGKALLEDDSADTPTAQTAQTAADGYDPVTDEIDRWAKLGPETLSKYFDESDDLLNEFQMMWDLRDRFPLHFIVFKQTACHLAHEANVEQIFSRAGNLSDPNMDPDFLAHLVMVAVNRKSFEPTLAAIKDKYFELYRGRGRQQGGASTSDDNADDDPALFQHVRPVGDFPVRDAAGL